MHSSSNTSNFFVNPIFHSLLKRVNNVKHIQNKTSLLHLSSAVLSFMVFVGWLVGSIVVRMVANVKFGRCFFAAQS